MAKVCVIFNPAAGRGRAGRALERLRAEVGPTMELRPTHEPGHAEQLALEAAHAGFAVVAAAGGDGTAHEVANGLLRAGRTDVVFHVLPVGSANDYAYALEREATRCNGTAGATAIRRVDVGIARRPDGRQRYFINGLGLGFNGAVTMQSRRIRWLRGVPLYSLALLRAVRRNFVCPPMTVTLDGKTSEGPTLALTVNLGRREGGFLMTPQCLLADGFFDYVHGGDLKRWELLRYLPAMVLGRLPADHPKLQMGRCKEVKVRSDSALVVHLDGELFCLPADGVHTLEVSILPAALAVCSGGMKALQAEATSMASGGREPPE